MDFLQGDAPDCPGDLLDGNGCGRCEKCFARMALAFEGDGSDVVPVEHLSRVSRLKFTPDQLAFIAEYGFLPLTPAASTCLVYSLERRGN